MAGRLAWMGVFALALMAGACWAMPATSALTVEVQAALDRGDAQHAASLAEEALRHEGLGAGERGRFMLYRGEAEELLGAHDQAMRDLTSALDTYALPMPERAEALLQRGFLRDGLGRLDEAAADYTALIALKDVSLATALNNRANIFRRQNRWDEALRDYRAALAAGNGKPQYSWYGLGQIAEAHADTLTARDYYAKAVAADPGYALASERIAALGGPPDGSVARSDDRVQLPPPQPLSGFTVAAQASLETNGTIVLRPPHADAGDKGTPIVLHPPKPRPHPSTSARSDVISPPMMQQARLILRPALDQAGQEARSKTRGALEVQLGSWRSQTEAHSGWEEAKERAGGVLDGLTPHIVAADLTGKGRYYRLRVTPTGERSAFCADLLAKGLACLPVRD